MIRHRPMPEGRLWKVGKWILGTVIEPILVTMVAARLTDKSIGAFLGIVARAIWRA